jgi:3-oxoacyl-[acyl-carrier-protein] synthase III
MGAIQEGMKIFWRVSRFTFSYLGKYRIGRKGTIGLITDIVEYAQKTYSDIDWFVPHQANQNINAFVTGSLGSEVEVRKNDAPLIKDKRWLSNIEKYGNLSAASIPLLFHENI